MQCLQCHHDNRATARFCQVCGAPVLRRCPQCATELAAQARFCDRCGSQLSSPSPASPSLSDGERRRATVMFCDLSGYTALGERLDPEEVEELLARIKLRAGQIVERHGGILNQFQGDGLLVLFGVPVAHEDDPARAVRAARELHTMVRSISPEVEQRIGKPLRLHSGINSGLVVTSLRDTRDGTVGITGDSANLAARLAELAQPDTILVGPETKRQIEDFFETTAQAPTAFRGKSEPLRPHRIERETPTQTRFEAAQRRGLTRFTGRESELAAMHLALGRSLAGLAQVLTVSGEPGLGKSRLAFEFRHGLDRTRISILEGRCQSYGTATPYRPFIDAMRRGLHLREDESGEAMQRRAVNNVLALDPALSAYLPQLLHLLSISSPDHALPQTLEGVQLRESLENALVTILAASAARRPVVLILEDWHWADPGSVSALQRLTATVPDRRLLTLVLYRPEIPCPIAPAPNHSHIALAPLGPQETGSIMCSVLGVADLPEGFGALVHTRTEGNPFFTEEIVAALREQGHIKIAQGEMAMSGSLETMALPESVQTTIRARVDRLPAAARDLLRLAAVIGREFEDEVLARMSSCEADVADTLGHLVEQDLLQRVRAAPQSEHMFKHVLIQSVVYDTLLLQQRRSLHARAGDAIETFHWDRLGQHCEALAWHYARSTETDKAATYCEMAGDKAAGVYSLDTARMRYREVLALLGASTDPAMRLQRVDVTIKLAKAAHYAASEETLAILEAARADAKLLEDPGRTARVASLMGGVYRMLGNHPKVFFVLGECARLAEELEDDEMFAAANHVMGRASYLTGDYARGIAYMERGIAISERVGNWAEVSYSLGFSADCWAWLGEFTRAYDLAERSLQLALDSNDLSRQGGSNWYLAAVCCMHGDWARGLEAAERCAGLARRIGGTYLLGAGLSTQGWAAFMLGRTDEGLDLMRKGLATMEDSGSRQGTGLYASWIADASALAGREDDARRYAQKALDFLARFGEGNGEAPAYRALAIAEACGPIPDWNVVEDHMRESVRAAEQRGERPQLAITCLRHAQFALKQGDSAFARAQLDRAQALFAETGMRWWPEYTARVRQDIT